MNKYAAVLAAFAFMFASFSPALAADPTGTWIDAQGDTKIKVTRCGDGLCGRVSWVKIASDPNTGKPKTDRHNEDASKRSRPLLGVPVLVGMKPNGQDKWSGRIYNADDGKTYTSYITVSGENNMNVQGCVLGGLICKSMAWTRSN